MLQGQNLFETTYFYNNSIIVFQINKYMYFVSEVPVQISKILLYTNKTE